MKSTKYIQIDPSEVAVGDVVSFYDTAGRGATGGKLARIVARVDRKRGKVCRVKVARVPLRLGGVWFALDRPILVEVRDIVEAYKAKRGSHASSSWSRAPTATRAGK